MTEYPFFEILPGYNQDTGEIGYVIKIVHSKDSYNFHSSLYENSFLAKQQIDKWEYDRKMTEKHMNIPPIEYNPRYVN